MYTELGPLTSVRRYIAVASKGCAKKPLNQLDTGNAEEKEYQPTVGTYECAMCWWCAMVAIAAAPPPPPPPPPVPPPDPPVNAPALAPVTPPPPATSTRSTTHAAWDSDGDSGQVMIRQRAPRGLTIVGIKRQRHVRGLVQHAEFENTC